MNPAEMLRQYTPVMEGIASLFYPFVEVAMHDLTTGKIVAMYNNVSRRNIGDPSPLSELGIPIEEFPDVFDPYYKTNWDGRRQKCTSITIRNELDKPVALICFNFDTTAFQGIQASLAALLGVKSTAQNPIELFKKNWREQIDGHIEQSLKDSNAQLSALPVGEKKKIVHQLYEHGLFNYKGAALYISSKLNVSRATVYNYLKSNH